MGRCGGKRKKLADLPLSRISQQRPKLGFPSSKLGIQILSPLQIAWMISSASCISCKGLLQLLGMVGFWGFGEGWTWCPLGHP